MNRKPEITSTCYPLELKWRVAPAAKPAASYNTETGSSGQRDLHIDALRGLCLVVITMNHMPRNVISHLTSEAFGFFNAAEGFVFLSGLVAGWLFTKTLNQSGMIGVRTRLLKRIGVIYAAFLLVSSAVLMLAAFGGDPFLAWRTALLGAQVSPWVLLVRLALLQQGVPHLSILYIYMIFFLAIPLMLRLAAKGKALLLLLFSMGLWTLAQPALAPALSGWPGFAVTTFSVAAWQLLFVIGFVLGHARFHGRHDALYRRRTLLFISGFLCLIFLAARHQRYFTTSEVGLLFDQTGWIFAKNTVGIVRLVSFLSAACLISFALRRFGRNIQSLWLHKKLAYLGQHSLQVFAWSATTSLVAMLFTARWPEWQPVYMLLAVFSLWIPAALHQRFRTYWKGRRTAAHERASISRLRGAQSPVA